MNNAIIWEAKQRGKRNGITVIQRIPIHKIIIIIYFNITQIRTHTHRIISLCEESIYGILSYWIWVVMIRSLDLQTPAVIKLKRQHIEEIFKLLKCDSCLPDLFAEQPYLNQNRNIYTRVDLDSL